MFYEIKNPYTNNNIEVEPKLELYRVKDFMGKEMPGLAIQLYYHDKDVDITYPYAMLTLSFGEFIGMKNCAYIDTNNCSYADFLLKKGVAKDTGFTMRSGFCEYPLWCFDENFLREIGEEKYEKYSSIYDEYMHEECEEECVEEDKKGNDEEYEI